MASKTSKLGAHGKKYADPLMVVVPAVWFRLVDLGSRKPFPTNWLRLTEHTLVAVLQEKVITKYGIKEIENSVLNVFVNEVAYNSRKKMDMTNRLGEYGSKCADPIIVEVPAVWVRLVDSGNGKALLTISLPLPKWTTVGGLQEAVITKCGIKGIESSVLERVCQRRLPRCSCSPKRMSLLSSMQLLNLGGDEDNFVVVAVPQNMGSERVWSIRIDQGYAEDVQQYQNTADRLKDANEVETMETAIKQVLELLTKKAFVVLENSSGTGKTQMAFNL
ncbi:unnamed protein product [Phytophthora lilii]|uniref:Unnamed protein product n=1 Tax=Phytophthora lilii TaxID=2077276 RepID=A0A9W6U747_9STRA|nr:unnamed protein product [Phytophthora lilii]